MDLENIGTSAFSIELLKSLAKDAYEKGRDEDYDIGFTAALCSIVLVAKKESIEEAMKYAEDFINGPLADKDAKESFDELTKMDKEVNQDDPR